MKRILAILLAMLMLIPFAISASAASGKDLTLDHVYQIDDKHLVLEFSEDVILGGAYIAVRWCTVSGGRPTLAWQGSKPLQFEPSGGDFIDGSRILLTFKESLDSILNHCEPYTAYLCIEENYPSTNDHTGLWDVLAASDPKKQLVPNRVETGGNWDAVYLRPEYKPDYEKIEFKSASETIYVPDMDNQIGKKFPDPKPYDASILGGGSGQTDAESRPAENETKEQSGEKSGCGSVLGFSCLPLLLLSCVFVKKKKK